MSQTVPARFQPGVSLLLVSLCFFPTSSAQANPSFGVDSLLSVLSRTSQHIQQDKQGEQDSDGDSVNDREDNCPERANPGQYDHDRDGVGDVCDPGTYTFSTLSPGDEPVGLTQETRPGVKAATIVKTSLGHAFQYDGPMWIVHRLERLSGERRHLDTDVTVDVTPDPTSVFSFELWSEGSAFEKAGSGLEFTLSLAGLAVRRRTGYRRKPVGTAKLPQRLKSRYLQRIDPPQPLRFRVRLRKGIKQTANIHVDWWIQDRWLEDGAVIQVNGVHNVLGRHVSLVHFGKKSRPLIRLTSKGIVPEAPLTLSRSFEGLDDWRVFQRGPKGAAPVPVPFAYRAEAPVRLEARLVKQATGKPVEGFEFNKQRWDLPAAPDGQFGEVVLDHVPQGGNYDLEVRLVAASGGALLGKDSVRHIGVGDIYLAAGQSNMSGYPLAMDPIERAAPMAHLFGNDYVWKQASEPMDDGSNQSDLISLDFPQHSLMLRFAKVVSKETGVPVAVIPASHGRTSLHKAWQRDASDPIRRNSFYGSAVYRALAVTHRHPIKGVLWYQGESDYMDKRPVPSYAKKIRELVDHFRRDLGNPNLYFITCQLATHSRAELERWMPYQDLQRRHAAEDPRAVLVPTLDFPRNDPVHLSVDGVKAAGERMAHAVLHLVHDQGPAPGPRLKAVSQSSTRSDQLVLQYDRPVTGGQASLFLATDMHGEARVLAVEGDEAELVLTLERALQAPATLQYGRVREPGGVDFVRDATGVAPVFVAVDVVEPINAPPGTKESPAQPPEQKGANRDRVDLITGEKASGSHETTGEVDSDDVETARPAGEQGGEGGKAGGETP